MKIAVEGCSHGQLDVIYDTIAALEEQNGFKVDLLLLCGDVQTMRNEGDLVTMSCPDKYKTIGNFYEYYTGARVAPIPTIFIGGNHEASNHLHELLYGGWVAPNIYYLGASGVVTFGGVRIGGLSGIFKSHDFPRGHHELSPYHDGAIRSIYHSREIDVLKLHQLTAPLDIMMSHDWPSGIAQYGDMQDLLRRKPFLGGDIMSGALGSPPAMSFLIQNRPAMWFSAHLHVKYAALVRHPPRQPGDAETSTRFLALDKCLPRRQFLQVVDIEERGPKRFEYDPEWLAITAHTAGLMRTQYPAQQFTPRDLAPTIERLAKSRTDAGIPSTDTWAIPHNFVMTTPPHNPQQRMSRDELFLYSQAHDNPQTAAFCDWLGIEMPMLRHPSGPRGGSHVVPVVQGNPEEISLEEGEGNPEEIALDEEVEHVAVNPEEISLDDE